MALDCDDVTVVQNDQEIPKELREQKSHPLYKSQDFAVWVTALVLFLFLTAGILGLGHLRGWDAQSGYEHNVSLTSPLRFLPEPYVDEPGVKGRYGSGASGRWYYWKLPPDQVTWLTRASMWICYLSHQFTVWILVYFAQRKQNEQAKVVYQHGLRWFNVSLFLANVFFHALHLGQTHWTYDALAQDTTITSSQGSVVVMLAFISVLEYRDRGLMFGWPSQYDHGKVSEFMKLPYSSMYLVRKYHGYGFSWAAIYTMWYHPMESTIGHVAGFFHTYILLVQASLIYTPMHLNKYWRFVLEAWVAVHSTIIALQTGGPEQLGTKLWPMFCFGFLMMICVSQIFGLPFWRRVPAATRIIPLACLLIVIVGMYSWIPDAEGRPWRRMYEVIFIPIVLILLPIFVFAVVYALLRIEACFKSRHHNKCVQFVFLLLALLMFLCCVTLGFCIQYFDVLMDITIMQNFVYLSFALLICVAIIFMKNAFDEKHITSPIPLEVENVSYDKVSDDKVCSDIREKST